MSITQIVEVPANHRLTIDVPREIPAGPVILTFRPTTVRKTDKAKQMHGTSFTGQLEEVRQLLQKEMAEKGTSKVKTVSGGGWEAHVREHYAES